MEIKVGDKVRSYDFPGCDDCYIEGTVTRIGVEFEGCPRYAIRITKTVFNGEVLPPAGRYANPPVNGTPTVFGGVTNGVVKL